MRRPFLAAAFALSFSAGTLLADPFLTAWDVSPLVPGESCVVVVSGSFPQARVRATFSFPGQQDLVIPIFPNGGSEGVDCREMLIPASVAVGQEVTITLEATEGEVRLLHTLKKRVVADAPELWLGNLGQPIGAGLSVRWAAVTRQQLESRAFEVASGDPASLEIKDAVFPDGRCAIFSLVGLSPGTTDYTLRVGNFAPLRIPVSVVKSGVTLASPRSMSLVERRLADPAFGPLDGSGQKLLSRQRLPRTPGINYVELTVGDANILRFADPCSSGSATYAASDSQFSGPFLAPAALGKTRVQVSSRGFVGIAQEIEVKPPTISLQGVPLVGAGLQASFICRGGHLSDRRLLRITSTDPTVLTVSAAGEEGAALQLGSAIPFPRN